MAEREGFVSFHDTQRTVFTGSLAASARLAGFESL
jgi:hypothetical protein